MEFTRLVEIACDEPASEAGFVRPFLEPSANLDLLTRENLVQVLVVLNLHR